MKKFIAMFLFVSFALAVQAGKDLNYVSVNGKYYFSNAVKIGLSNIRFSTDNGMTLKAPLRKVDAIMVDGKLLERLPVYCVDGKYKGTALMEFVSQRNGLKLYKYHPTENPPLNCCFHDNSQKSCVFFIYKEGELYLHIDNQNAGTVFPFFHVTYKNVNEA
jgi:hypothetical protein